MEWHAGRLRLYLRVGTGRLELPCDADSDTEGDEQGLRRGHRIRAVQAGHGGKPLHDPVRFRLVVAVYQLQNGAVLPRLDHLPGALPQQCGDAHEGKFKPDDAQC